MVKKTDKPPKVPYWHEWKEQVLTRTAPWWPNNKFVSSEKDWTIEEYLESCEEEYPLSERNEKIIKELDANPEFVTTVRELRERFRVEPSDLRAMSKEEWISWYSHHMPIDPETREDVRASCLRLRLTPRWQDFVLSRAFFDDGRAGYEDIFKIFDDCFGDPSTGLVEVSFYVSPYLRQRDLFDELWDFIKDMKSLMYGQPKLRLPRSPAHDFQRLLYYLGVKEGKTVAEIDQILTDVLEEDPPKPLDESIKKALPEASEEELRKLIMDEFKKRWVGPSRIRTRIWRLHKKLGLRSVDVRYPFDNLVEEKHAIELYKLRRRRYHY